MPKLNCNAESCMHNSQDCCCLGEINVAGNKAQTSSQTCCSNFYEDIGHARDAIEQGSPTTYTEVQCGAQNCVYNRECRCEAAAVDVSGYGAIQSEDTCCSSFVPRS